MNNKKVTDDTRLSPSDIAESQPDDSFYQMVLDNIGDGVYFVDPSRTITYWNKGAEQITGYTADEVVGKPCFNNILNHIDCRGNQLCHNGCPLLKTIQDGQTRQDEILLHHKDGYRVPIVVRVNPIRNKSNQIIGAIETFSDIQAKLALQNKIDTLKQKVNIDELTQLPNRRYLEYKLEMQHEIFLYNNETYGILFFDIDHFKNTNDSYGHDFGDLILQSVAKTLKLNSRPDDLIGRWGGDEFLGIIPNVSSETLIQVAERTRILVENSRLKCIPENVGVTISIGAAKATKKDSIESLLKRADTNLYQSKNKGRNCFTVDIEE